MLVRGTKEKSWHAVGPKPKRSTRFRLIGPIGTEHGSVWRIWDYRDRRQFGPDCCSMLEARKVLEDAVTNRTVTYFGKTRLVPKDVAGDMMV